MNKGELISLTPDAEKTMAHIARVSNPSNQANDKFAGLLRYCIKHEHWSVFEQSCMTLKIETNRGIAAQILRHRSFTFQEFSQRYAETNLLGNNIPIPNLRRQDQKNRQNSIDDISDDVKRKFTKKISNHFDEANKLYEEMLKEGIAKECARFYYAVGNPNKNIYDGLM